MDHQWKYRTVDGIQRDTEVAPEHIGAVLNQSCIATASVFKSKGNEAVYARADEPKSFTERLEKIKWVFAR